MSDHYVVMADHGHVRIFRQQQPPGQATPGFEEVQAVDFPAGVRSYTDRDTDVAGRFQGSKHQSRAPGSPIARTGMSIDERLPMQREEQRRDEQDVSETIESFLQARPDATWDFAAGPQIHHAVLDALSAQTKSRLRRAVTKDLVHQPLDTLRAQFGIS